MADWKNKLYFGDNLGILREHVRDESVDLVYLDPPFNSNATYNVLFKEAGGEGSAAQIHAFDDTWHWSMQSTFAYQDVVTNGPKKLADLLQTMRSFLGQNDMMAYLTMMAQRMTELHRVLKPTGSVYLHCDPTASHYLKAAHGRRVRAGEFQSEIIWKRYRALIAIQRPNMVRCMTQYSKRDSVLWSPSFQPYDSEYVERVLSLHAMTTGSVYVRCDNWCCRLRVAAMNPSGMARPGLAREWIADLSQGTPLDDKTSGPIVGTHSHRRIWRVVPDPQRYFPDESVISMRLGQPRTRCVGGHSIHSVLGTTSA